MYVIDGSLYCLVPNGGFELITYTGRNADHVQVADGTVRISGYAFAGSGVKMVTLPYTVAAVGHKAFYGCQDLQMVVFTSFDAPILEEEFDQNYFETYENLPGSGTGYGEYTDYDGTQVVIEPLGVIPYFMWNVSGNYSNVFYGANFIDYIGHIDNKIVMVRPSNGQYYETFIFDQYFNLAIDGDVAAEDATLAAIAAINRIPERVQLEHEDIILAARAAYSKVATLQQQALIENYSKLTRAEKRLQDLKEDGTGATPDVPSDVTPEPTPEPTPVNVWMIVAIVALCLVAVAGIFIAVLFVRMRKTDEIAEETPAAEEAAETEAEEENTAK